jgi:hypothetical protein
MLRRYLHNVSEDNRSAATVLIGVNANAADRITAELDIQRPSTHLDPATLPQAAVYLGTLSQGKNGLQ